ncbi:hypothetical protein CTAM01_10647 [Colletotrichum tamarilloi]|uniref:Uncharacterized protein n=1 Tax=Colletotrichum tamarilloi TaxID=1209934 RepID=A0ABQ9QZZ1_9PEZI|nr:uncharacterized protein CTAM01_10647 [Colletotrichum tamarilloi]KAK1490721.1 hypothetical protein CTAM01_10647 [Colletotrichum tamarilloi]
MTDDRGIMSEKGKKHMGIGKLDWEGVGKSVSTVELAAANATNARSRIDATEVISIWGVGPRKKQQYGCTYLRKAAGIIAMGHQLSIKAHAESYPNLGTDDLPELAHRKSSRQQQRIPSPIASPPVSVTQHKANYLTNCANFPLRCYRVEEDNGLGSPDDGMRRALPIIVVAPFPPLKLRSYGAGLNKDDTTTCTLRSTLSRQFCTTEPEPQMTK